MKSKETGNVGEKMTEDYLKKKGYRILDINYYFKIPENPQRGEIDIIAKKDDIISFIEVKTLREFDSFLPEDKVNFGKRKKLIKAAESWLIRNRIPLDSKWQIDVISILIKNRETKISHFENAIPYC